MLLYDGHDAVSAVKTATKKVKFAEILTKFPNGSKTTIFYVNVCQFLCKMLLSCYTLAAIS